ncbi:MAG: citrate synthase [Myxococcota bacterium]
MNSSGLEGVVAMDTYLSEVDGERGRLVVAGYDIEELALSAGFAGAAHLLWTGQRPSAEAEARLGRALGQGRRWAFDHLRGGLEEQDPMASLASGLAALELPKDADAETQRAHLAAAVPVLVAAWWAHQSGRALLAPEPGAPHAQDILRLINGQLPAPALARALETYLVTVMDHGMNASTFTARVVASTGASDKLALSAAVGALSGPLHGGAPGPVLDMLDAIGSEDRARSWLDAELAAGRRIMGMGHRIYRVRDPRVVVLERAAEALSRAGHSTQRLRLARAVEAAAESLLAKKHPDRALKANVELATAVLLDAAGVPRQLFSPMFAVGRAVGWLAHIAEQKRTGRLIRPDARYIGPSAPPPG